MLLDALIGWRYSEMTCSGESGATLTCNYQSLAQKIHYQVYQVHQIYQVYREDLCLERFLKPLSSLCDKSSGAVPKRVHWTRFHSTNRALSDRTSWHIPAFKMIPTPWSLFCSLWWSDTKVGHQFWGEAWAGRILGKHGCEGKTITILGEFKCIFGNVLPRAQQIWR